MQTYNPDDTPSTKTSFLPPPQAYLLIAVLVGYPALSITMNALGSNEPSAIHSRISQVYLPALILQAVIIAAIWLVLKRTGERFDAIGLAWRDVNWSNVLSGIIFFIGAWSLMIIVRAPIDNWGSLPERNFAYLLPSTPGEKTVWFLLSVGAAFSEEICFRGFVVTRLKIISGSFWVGALLSSAAFSLGHLYQGLAGVALTFLYGLLFVGLFVARRSLFPCIVAHFLQDVIVLFALVPR